MRRGWRIGRIGGVDIRIDPSLLVIVLLITFSLWGQLSARFPPPSTPLALGVAVATAVLFFLSILAHELAHAGVARLRRIPVAGITLFLFGGATEAKMEGRGPGDEFVVTVVGPLMSLAVGVGFLLIQAAASLAPGSVVDDMLGALGRGNLALGVFNLVPGFPLDGGRVLRSVVWWRTGSYRRATRVAGRAGQVVGGALAAIGLVQLIVRSDFNYAWFALIGWFLFQAATQAVIDSDRRLVLERTTAGDVMAPAPPTVDADAPIGATVEGLLRGHEHEAFPVTDDGRVVGFVSLSTVDGIPPDRPVREAMTDPSAAVEAAPTDTLEAVTQRLGGGSQVVLVMDGGRLVGVIEPDDLDRFLRQSGRTPRRPDYSDPT
ncbi:MAG TPA: site-2 protease family protein [Actinomycetota bacterium]|nr:site-2 protease family protein [Actinomycetota bacterium]